MAEPEIRIHGSWIGHDEELLRPLTQRLDALQDELPIEVNYSRHPVGWGIDDEALDGADIVLLMVSPEYIEARSARREVDRAIALHREGASVYAVMVRESDVSALPFEVLPRSGTAIADASDRTAVYDEIFEFLRVEIDRRLSRPLQEAAVKRAVPPVPPTRQAVSHAYDVYISCTPTDRRSRGCSRRTCRRSACGVSGPPKGCVRAVSCLTTCATPSKAAARWSRSGALRRWITAWCSPRSRRSKCGIPTSHSSRSSSEGTKSCPGRFARASR